MGCFNKFLICWSQFYGRYERDLHILVLSSKQDFISSNSMIAWIFERQDIYKNLSELMRKHG